MKTRVSGIILLIFTATLAFASDLQIVIARGIGNSADAALKDALNQAVQQVVGSMVSSEAFVKNDELIKEQILTYSDGFVQKYEVLKPAKVNSGGLVEISIKAFVAQKVLQKRLETVNVIKVKVEGAQNVWAQLETEKFRKENAETLLIKTLSLLKPTDYLHVTLIDKNGNTGSKAQLNVIPTDDPARVKISMGAIVTVNHKKFVSEVQPVLKDVLEKLCTAKSMPFIQHKLNDKNLRCGFSVNKKGEIVAEYFGNNIHFATGESSSRKSTSIRFISASQNNDMIGIALNESRRYNSEQQKFTCYFFPRTRSLDKFLDQLFYHSNHILTFIVRDQDGEEIQRYSQKILDNLYGHALLHFYGSGSCSYGISPEIMCGHPESFSNHKPIKINFDIKLTDVKDIRSMELILEERK